MSRCPSAPHPDGELQNQVVADERLPSVTYPLQSVPMLTTFSTSREVRLREPIATCRSTAGLR